LGDWEDEEEEKRKRRGRSAVGRMVGRGRPRRAVTHSSVEEKKIEPQMDVNERRWKRKSDW
jgi:hypothetical protein